VAEDTPEEQAEINEEDHHKCVNRFVELANAMKDEGLEPRAVSHALMSASGIYATYAIAGNANGLNQAGVERLAEIFQANLENIQRSKREQQRE
jgi:hypothetical protein